MVLCVWVELQSGISVRNHAESVKNSAALRFIKPGAVIRFRRGFLNGFRCAAKGNAACFTLGPETPARSIQERARRKRGIPDIIPARINALAQMVEVLRHAGKAAATAADQDRVKPGKLDQLGHDFLGDKTAGRGLNEFLKCVHGVSVEVNFARTPR
jgi:hypothetical protein